MRTFPFRMEGEFLVRSIMRSDAREAAFKLVFAEGFGTQCDSRFRMKIYRGAKLSEEECAFAEELFNLVREHREELVSKLLEKVPRYSDYRLFAVDKAIMLVGLAEMLYIDSVPPVVSVSEATALAKKYSEETSVGFVNGVLGGFLS